MQRPRDPDEAEQLLTLVGTAYDAAIDPELWPDAVAEVCRFLNCASGAVGAADLLRHDANFLIQWGYPPDAWQDYLDNYYYRNPTIPQSSRSRIGEIMTLAGLPNYPEIIGSEFFTDWVAPLGIVDVVQGTLDKTASSISLLTCARHKDVGLVGEAEIRRMRLIMPHFRRAVLIGKLLDMRALQAATFAEAIDGLATGVFLVSPLGEIVHANAAGQAVLDEGDPLKLVRGILVAADERVQSSLRKAFAAALEGDAAIEAGGIALPLLSPDGGRFVAHVLPLTSGARHAAGAYHSATAALFVREASIDLPAAINAAGQLYGLTPAEEKVLRAVIEVGGIAPVASLLGASHSTVKTHLEHLFEKTGTRRQAELVKLIAGLDSPARRSKSEQK
ncbi:MAG: helix-turn-helix transcriptional regulator [Methyloceanibacter sp.]|uniref:helix-turn-helix transcriptional regulator n=1 Tax=Methyloceanibacter sp. TaxID=1965321 RepID=UPI003D6C8925